VKLFGGGRRNMAFHGAALVWQTCQFRLENCQNGWVGFRQIIVKFTEIAVWSALIEPK
jgi:hypothetical protein